MQTCMPTSKNSGLYYTSLKALKKDLRARAKELSISLRDVKKKVAYHSFEFLYLIPDFHDDDERYFFKSERETILRLLCKLKAYEDQYEKHSIEDFFCLMDEWAIETSGNLCEQYRECYKAIESIRELIEEIHELESGLDINDENLHQTLKVKMHLIYTYLLNNFLDDIKDNIDRIRNYQEIHMTHYIVKRVIIYGLEAINVNTPPNDYGYPYSKEYKKLLD